MPKSLCSLLHSRDTSGACGTIALLQCGVLVVANVGDCAAVLYSTDDQGKPVDKEITTPHRATIYSERKRIMGSRILWCWTWADVCASQRLEGV